MRTKKIRCIGSFLLSMILVLSCVLTLNTETVHAAAESKTNPAESISVTYEGGTMIVGKSVAKSDLTVIAKLKDGTKVELSNYTIKNKKITSESHKLTVSYKNKKDETLTAAVTIPAITDFRNIKATLKDGYEFDFGDKITKDMFEVKASLSNGKTKILDKSAYSLSNSKYDADGKTSMSVTVSATNAEGKEKTSRVTVKANKVVKSIKIKEYKGETKDIGDNLDPSDFIVEGTTYGGEKIEIKDFDLEPSTVEKTTNFVKVVYTNTLGKSLKSPTYKMIAAKCIEKIDTVEYIGGDKQISDSISKEDFRVTGKTYGNETVEITNFEIDKAQVTTSNQSVRISYTNTAGKTLTKTGKITAGNKMESMTAELKSKKTVGDTLKASDFKITGRYHDGSEKTVAKGITLDKTTVDSLNMSVTITYTDTTGYTVTTVCTFTASDTVSSNDGVIITCTKNGTYKVGDTVSASDFTGTAATAGGSTTQVTNISIKSGNKLTDTTNEVVVFYKVGGVSGTKSIYVVATDWVKDVEAEITNSAAYAAGATINGSHLANMVKLNIVYASGKIEEVSNIMTDSRVSSIKAEGQVELKIEGKRYTLKSGTNKFVVTFADLQKGIEKQNIEFTIKPDFKKTEVKIAQKKNTVYLDCGMSYTLSELVNITDGSNSITNKLDTSNYPKVTVSATGGKYSSQVITVSKDVAKLKLTISTSGTNQYTSAKETFSWNVRKLKGSTSKTLKVGKTYNISDFVTSNDKSTSIKMKITSGSSYASVSSGKLSAKKTGTVKVKFTQGSTSMTVTAKITT